MRRGRILIVVALILILCVVVGYLLTRRTPAPGPGEGTPQAPDSGFIVVAAQDIPRGGLITRDHLADPVPFPADSIVETMLTDPGQAVGFWARQEIARGLPITENMITKEPGTVLEGGSDAAIAIPRGMTAIAVPITRLSSVAYALRPGDKVDVLATLLLVDLDRDFQSREPNNTLIMLGGLQSIPHELYDAASVDGANTPQRFFFVTVPLMRGVILFVAITSSIGLLNLFVQPFLLFSSTQGLGPEQSVATLNTIQYSTAFQSHRYGEAAALGFIIAILVITVSLVQLRMTRSVEA